VQSFTLPAQVYAQRLTCGEYAERIDNLTPSIRQAADGWYYCRCGKHRFRWEQALVSVADEVTA